MIRSLISYDNTSILFGDQLNETKFLKEAKHVIQKGQINNWEGIGAL